MRTRFLPAFAILFLAGCAASVPVLPGRAGGNPEHVDLTGQWELRGAAALPIQQDQTIYIPTIRDQRMQQARRNGRRSRGSSVHIFLTTGRHLKVTQTVYALFFSYDRAVVNEYNFGENRTATVGPIEAQRVSGWDGAAFVVETMDREGNRLTERWSLAAGGAVLQRDISIDKGEKNSLSTRQVFERR
jgi:hypothetical protein